MGKTVPTYSKVLEEELRRWKKFERILRKREREAFEEIKDYARLHTTAGMNMASPDSFKPMILSVLLEQQKEIEKLKEMVEERKGI